MPSGWEQILGEPDGRRRLPPVDAILKQELLAEPIRRRGRVAVRGAVRDVMEGLRRALSDVAPGELDPASIARRSLENLERERPALRAVINATGVLLHTGLGR